MVVCAQLPTDDHYILQKLVARSTCNQDVPHNTKEASEDL